jgi:hypothetical protein
MPKSNGYLKNGWLCSSFEAHAWLPDRITVGTSAYDMHPRQMRETFSPVLQDSHKENATLVAGRIFPGEYCGFGRSRATS